MEAFENLLRQRSPAFACYARGDKAQVEEFTAPVFHFASPPAFVPELNKIPEVPGSDAALAFYASHNGAKLYSDRSSPTPSSGPQTGIEIFPIHKWEERTTSMVESWTEGEYPDDEMPYGRHDFIAFAHCHGASSHMHWIIRGPHSGAIYWWAWTNRPSRDTAPLIPSFSKFIEILCTDPVHMMNDLLDGYTLFSGIWKPGRYLPEGGGQATA